MNAANQKKGMNTKWVQVNSIKRGKRGRLCLHPIGCEGGARIEDQPQHEAKQSQSTPELHLTLRQSGLTRYAATLL